MIYKCTVCYFK